MADRVRSRVWRFGEFVLDLSAYDLREGERSVKIERQPMELLILLVERHGELVTRAEIVDRLWGHDVFVDVDTGVNTLIRKIRRVLRDSAETPQFIQTVQGKGYRFIGAVDEAAVTVVAVLPFENLQREPALDYVADGLTEETIVGLGQVGHDRLSVIGRTSSMAYRGTQKTLDIIGRELGADFVLEGSVRTAQDRCRVAASLIRVKDQVPVWAETFEREAHDLLHLQAALGRAIAHEIHDRVASSHREPPVPPRHTGHTSAYDWYLRGRHHFHQMTAATAVRALECFQRATEIDPTYALAWAGLADLHTGRLFSSEAAPAAIGDVARMAAMRAIQHGALVPEAHIALARVLMLLDWSLSEAEVHLRRALTLDPSSADAHWVLARALSHQGRHAQALDAALRGRAMDPFNALSLSMLAQTAFSARDFDAAAHYAREAQAAEPDHWLAHHQLAQSLEALGQPDEALVALADATRLSNEHSMPLSLSAYIQGRTGRHDEALAVVSHLEQRARERYVPPLSIALGYAGVGDDTRAFEWLDRAVSARDVYLIYVPGDVKWDRFRSDPRLRRVLQRCGFDQIDRPQLRA